LIFTVSGLGRFGYGSGEILAEPGDLVLVAPGTLHDYGVEPQLRRWELLWSHFHPRPHWTEFLRWPVEASGLMRLRLGRQDRAEATRRMEEVFRLATLGLRRSELLAMNRLEDFLLWCDCINPRSQQGRLDPRVAVAIDYVCRHLHEKMPMPRLAKVASLSVSRLAHLFREQTGMTPQRFIEMQRLDRAKQLLELTQRTVATVAYDVGFENPFYFSLRFKRYTEVSPSEYRRRRTTTAGA